MMDKIGFMATALSIACAIPIALLGYIDPVAGLLSAVSVWLGLRCANLAIELRDYKARDAALARSQMQNQIAFMNSVRKPY
jgi:hypothetical protein